MHSYELNMSYHAYKLTTHPNFDNNRQCVNQHLLQSTFEWTATLTYQSIKSVYSDDTPELAQQGVLKEFNRYCYNNPNNSSVIRFKQLANLRKHELELAEKNQFNKRPRRIYT